MPTAASDKLIEGRMQHGRIDRIAERRLPVIAKPDDRRRPASVVIGIAFDVAPKDGAPLIGKLPGKGSIDPDKSVLNKLL
jgi:hypothetical protein